MVKGGEMLDDIKLINRCKKGEKKAFEKLIKKYYLTLYKFFYKNSEDKMLSEDMTHETTIKLIEGIDKFKLITGVKFKTWLFKIAYNTYVDYLRKNNKVQYTPFEDVEMSIESNFDIQDSILRNEEKDSLYTKLDCLPENMKLLVTLRYINGFGYGEISKITGISKAKIKSRLHYAMEKLRALYKEEVQ